MSGWVWELRNPDGASQGLEYARARLAPTERVLAHALPERVNVEVYDDDRKLVAHADDLKGGESSPMAMLEVADGAVTRRNLWPDDTHLGLPVILAGGEVGILTAWWHADDKSEWTWSIELHNHA